MDKEIKDIIESATAEISSEDFSREAVMERLEASSGDRYDFILSESTSYSATLLGEVLTRLKEQGLLGR